MPEDNDQNLNPGQSDYDRKFNFNPKNIDDNNYSDNISNTANDLKNAEESSDAPWKYDYEKEKELIQNLQNKDLRKGKAMLRLAKRKGPITAIILSIVGGGIITTTLLSPSLLILQFKEVMTNAFNYQHTSMSVRTTKLLVSKMNTTSGLCSGKVTIKCKYSSMSEKQIANFEKAGITVIADTEASKTLTGRTVIKEIEFNGEKIAASDLKSAINKMPEFRNALYRAYNPKFAGFSDALAKVGFSKVGVNKAKTTIEGETFEEKFNNLDTEITDKTKVSDIELKSTDINPDTGNTYADDGIDIESKQKAINEMIELSGQQTGVIAEITNGSKTVLKAVSATSIANDACTVYLTYRAVGYAAKTIRVTQLATYAMLFLNIADQIKAGDANPDDVSFFGTILTNASTDDFGNDLTATDSFGYKYAAYNEAGYASTNTMRYATAELSTGLVSAILAGPLFSNISKGTTGVCRALNSIGGLIFTAALSVIAAVASGGTSEAAALSYKSMTVAAQQALKKSVANISKAEIIKTVGVGAGIAFLTTYLPAVLGDIVAGNIVDADTVGANAGDAITSGSSGIMASVAKAGGNAPLTVDQAVEYSKLSKKVNKEDSVVANQFDVNDSNSFVGKIANTLIPYVSKLSSLTGIISSISSINSKSISGLVSTNTLATDDATQYSQCTDTEYRNLNLATDPFCNVMYGIEPDALEIDPNDVNDKLLNVKIYNDKTLKDETYPLINSETGDPIEEYSDFVNSCINRDSPLGSKENTSTDGSECVFGKTMEYAVKNSSGTDSDLSINNKYFYLHYIDQRINKGMDGDDSTLNAAIESGYNSDLAFYNSTSSNSKTSDNFIANIFKFFNLGWSN